MPVTYVFQVYKLDWWPAFFALLLATPLLLADDAPAVSAKAKQATVLVDMEAGGTGSGFCFDRRGYFLTNAHVVESVELGGTASVVVQPGTKEEQVHRAVVVSSDPQVDLAVLFAPIAKNMEVLALAKANGVAEAEPVVCLGYPFGRRLSVKDQKYPSLSINRGTVSAVRRSAENVEVLQIDAAVNPGHSGGPVLTRSGDVAGVLFTGVRGASLCFAIPAETVLEFLKRPAATIHVPEISFSDRRREREFAIELQGFQDNPIPQAVTLSLQPELGSRRTVAMTKKGNRFSVSVPAESPKKGADALFLELERDGVRRRVPCVDRSLQVGAADRMLSSIRMLEKHQDLYVVTGADGKRIAAAVSGLDQIESNPSSSPAKLSEAGRILVFSAETNSAAIYYQFVAKVSQKSVGQWEGRLPVLERPAQLRPEALRMLTDSLKPTAKTAVLDRNELLRQSRDACREWEQTPPLKDEAWTSLSLAKYELASGGRAEQAKDGSIEFFNGEAERDTYSLQLELPVPPSRVTGLQVEVLPDPRFHSNGPGQFYGNFVLTNLEAALLNKGTGKSTPVVFRRISADHFQAAGPNDPNEWKVHHAIDADPGSGWAIRPKTGERHVAVLEIEPNSKISDNQRLLSLSLVQNYGARHTIGKLRISCTTQKRPLVCPTLPANVQEASRIPRKERTPEQQAAVDQYFDQTDMRLQIPRAEASESEVPLASFLKEYDPAVPAVDELEIQVRICGKSRLIVERDGLRWEHESEVKPGLGGKTGPHVLVNGIPWYLKWRTSPPTSDTPDSSELFELCLGAAVWEARVISIDNESDGARNDGRGTIRTTHERFETVFDFDDSAPGNGVYRLRLSAKR